MLILNARERALRSKNCSKVVKLCRDTHCELHVIFRYLYWIMNTRFVSGVKTLHHEWLSCGIC